jgi:tetratricopeptide (TPR) repeat protein
LRATIEWSYDLLDENERLLFERLSVFHGGSTLKAAEEICEADIDTLQSLIDKSLLRRQGERFWMLETIREYAAERLERHGEGVVLADRHADYFIALTEAAARGAPDEDVEQTRGLFPDLDNFRCALDWLVVSGDVERELRLATRVFWCLWTRSSLRELHGSLASALERAANADIHLRGEALGAAALAAANLGETEVARAYARESLALARERDDKRQIEWALRVLSFDEPDLDERRRLLHECERLVRELGNDAGLGWVTYLRGMTFVDEGGFDSARETFEQAAALFRGLGRRWEATTAEIAVGYTLVAADRHAEARPLLEGALASAVDIGSPGSIMETLVLLATVRMEADVAAATRLLAGVRTIADESGRELDPRFEGRVLETMERTARERLGQQFAAEWQAGSGLTLEETVALALDEE